jgi:nucleotide-binding universal stress UspA family protein
VSSSIYLVPHDFTSVGETATRHALEMARQTRGEVHLLNIVKSTGEKPEAQKKFDEAVAKLNLSASDPKVVVHVEAGNIFTDIAKKASEIRASYIIMGTHGAKGMQKVFGSFAIKVITSTFVPFIIVTEGSIPRTKIQKIVFPINSTSESLQISKFAGNKAEEFNREIHIIAPQEKDLELKRKITIYMDLVNKQLQKKNLKVITAMVEKKKAYQDAIMQYAKEQKADIIAISYHSDRLLPQLDSFAQSLITNSEKLPVLIINSKEVTSTYY